jgi:hypothetical protein
VSERNRCEASSEASVGCARSRKGSAREVENGLFSGFSHALVPAHRNEARAASHAPRRRGNERIYPVSRREASVLAEKSRNSLRRRPLCQFSGFSHAQVSVHWSKANTASHAQRRLRNERILPVLRLIASDFAEKIEKMLCAGGHYGQFSGFSHDLQAAHRNEARAASHAPMRRRDERIDPVSRRVACVLAKKSRK